MTEEISNQHFSEAFCIQEVKNCKNESLGLNFVAFIGNRYGSRSLPIVIEKEEFEKLLLKDSSLNKSFKLDENNKPANYVLLVSSIKITFP